MSYINYSITWGALFAVIVVLVIDAIIYFRHRQSLIKRKKCKSKKECNFWFIYLRWNAACRLFFIFSSIAIFLLFIIVPFIIIKSAEIDSILPEARFVYLNIKIGVVIGGSCALSLMLWWTGFSIVRKTRSYLPPKENITWFIPRNYQFTYTYAMISGLFLSLCMFTVTALLSILYLVIDKTFIYKLDALSAEPHGTIFNVGVAAIAIGTFLLSESIRKSHSYNDVRRIDEMLSDAYLRIKEPIEGGKDDSIVKYNEIESEHSKDKINDGGKKRDNEINYQLKKIVLNALDDKNTKRIFIVDKLPTIGFFSCPEIAYKFIAQVFKMCFRFIVFNEDTGEVNNDQYEYEKNLRDFAYYPYRNITKIVCVSENKYKQIKENAMLRFPERAGQHDKLFKKMVGCGSNDHDLGVPIISDLEREGVGVVWKVDDLGHQHFISTENWVVTYGVDPRDTWNDVRGQFSGDRDLVDFYKVLFNEYVSKGIVPKDIDSNDNSINIKINYQPNIHGYRVMVRTNKNEWARVVPNNKNNFIDYYDKDLELHYDIAQVSIIKNEQIEHIGKYNLNREYLWCVKPFGSEDTEYHILEIDKKSFKDACQKIGVGVTGDNVLYIILEAFKKPPCYRSACKKDCFSYIENKNYPCLEGSGDAGFGNFALSDYKYCLFFKIGNMRLCNPYYDILASGPSDPFAIDLRRLYGNDE